MTNEGQLLLPMDTRSRRERTAARLRAQISDKPRNRCHGCGRRATECWIMPCLVLVAAIHLGGKGSLRSARAINRWAERSGAPFRVQVKAVS